jgi:hypothetical protein
MTGPISSPTLPFPTLPLPPPSMFTFIVRILRSLPCPFTFSGSVSLFGQDIY